MHRNRRGPFARTRSHGRSLPYWLTGPNDVCNEPVVRRIVLEAPSSNRSDHDIKEMEIVVMGHPDGKIPAGDENDAPVADGDGFVKTAIFGPTHRTAQPCGGRMC